MKLEETAAILEVLIEKGVLTAPGPVVVQAMVENYYKNCPLDVPPPAPPLASKPPDIAGRVRQWVEQVEGGFSNDDIFVELGLLGDDRGAARAALQRMATKRDLIERVGAKRGQYRRIDDNLQKVDYLNATGKEYPIILPFNLHHWVKLYPKAIVIIAGSSNAGKSALLLNVVRDNMNTHKIHYFTSEFSADDLKIRLDNFGIDPKDWIWDVYERSRDFHDVVDPEGLNIIDYMDVPEGYEPYQMNRLIDKIFQRLTTGIALIALQKRPGKDSAVGGEATIERARLAINMDRADISKDEVYNTLTMRKAKSSRYHQFNPYGWEWQYNLIKGCDFKIVNCPSAVLAERELRKQECWEGK
jgi:hypothetical protein